MRRALSNPVVKMTLSLLIGIGLLFLISRFIDIHSTFLLLAHNLATPRGCAFALLSGIAFLLAFSIRGVRWKLFLNLVGDVSILMAVRLVLISIFINFLLPVSSGELAKPIMLKRVSNIPISRSLPTVAMDRALDLLPAIFIMVLVPLLGIQLDIKLWLAMGTVSALLVVLVIFIGLAAWKYSTAIALLCRITGMLPGRFGNKVASLATNFVDALLVGASRPKIFIPALLLTGLAIIFDSLFAMFAFWTIGFPLSFGTALFGYTVYNIFYIFPKPPGQVGSNEAVGLLVFNGLLHLPASKVTAMFIFSHPWAALLMWATCMVCLKTLGLTIGGATQVQTEESKEVISIEQEEIAAEIPT
ncbi:MAG TPA: lysylphosphatidylglycerol synthase transmembrane domain-containing protein [Ktedonobacteraceae bacterium]|nr:lysylphosphatidylglycerol synthase transmembrane domain-containing protein [Ktedonobacteraceae bacterium]